MSKRSSQPRKRSHTRRGPRSPEYKLIEERRMAQILICQNCGNVEVDSEGHCDECDYGVDDIKHGP
jgi:ribosomal protein L32